MFSNKSQREVEDIQLGVWALDALEDLDADHVQNMATKAWMDGNLKLWQRRAGINEDGLPGDPEGDDMGHSVEIGNTIHNHYQGGTMTVPPAVPATQQPVTVAPTTNGNGLSTLGKVLLGASLVGGGAGGLALTQMLTKPAATSSVDTDTDTRTTVTFPE